MNAMQWDIAAWVAAGLGVCAAIGAAVIFVRWDMPRVGAILSGRAARREMEGFRLAHRENAAHRENLAYGENLVGRMRGDAVDVARDAPAIAEPDCTAELACTAEPDPTVLSDSTVIADRIVAPDNAVVSDRTLVSDQTLISDRTLISDGTLMSPARDPPGISFAVPASNQASAQPHSLTATRHA
ncbi:hypothetical protein PSRA_1580 [Pseudoscardovia radai]|uniref:Uncharacterized protein n=1 Tax=Pseudoscardovia radai TaxID=987066 RepID=A0A261ESG5_9BIFI|nr:hypothetical protein [Pseudoscardovia radai]OZG49775.1 hypothetical protein PSRA_1580 [Pseudoscardovia radai]